MGRDDMKRARCIAPLPAPLHPPMRGGSVHARLAALSHRAFGAVSAASVLSVY